MFGQQLPFGGNGDRVVAAIKTDKAHMKVSGPGRISAPSVKKAKGKRGAGSAGGADFAAELPAVGGATTQGVSGAGPVVAVDALLGLQEVADATDHSSRGILHGTEMLDVLEDIRRGLLLGTISQSRLQTLAQLLKNRKDQPDPVLDEILDDIELRARVELAKLEYPRS